MEGALLHLLLPSLHVLLVVDFDDLVVEAADALLVNAVVALRVHRLLLQEGVVVVEREVHLPHYQVGQSLPQVLNLLLFALVGAEVLALILVLPAELLAKLHVPLVLDGFLEGQKERLFPAALPLLR